MAVFDHSIQRAHFRRSEPFPPSLDAHRDPEGRSGEMDKKVGSASTAPPALRQHEPERKRPRRQTAVNRRAGVRARANKMAALASAQRWKYAQSLTAVMFHRQHAKDRHANRLGAARIGSMTAWHEDAGNANLVNRLRNVIAGQAAGLPRSWPLVRCRAVPEPSNL